MEEKKRKHLWWSSTEQLCAKIMKENGIPEELITEKILEEFSKAIYKLCMEACDNYV